MTIKLQGGKVITKAGKASCECCGCPYPFDFFTLLSASQKQINYGDNSRWPEDVEVSAWTQIASIDEEPVYPGSFSFPILFVQRSQKGYDRFFKPPETANHNGECARFVCANVFYNPQTGNSSKSLTPYGGPTTTGRDLKELILQYVPTSIWQQTRYLLFKIEFYAWWKGAQTNGGGTGGGIYYNFHESSDTKFTIKYATFTLKNQLAT
jgi:hypothetical protein